MIFGQHDLAQRAPFPHIDLVLCRNVLMYFTPELQHRVLRLFAFALCDGGYLALGKAETSKPLGACFAPADEHVKLYRRHGERVLPLIERTTTQAMRPLTDASTALGSRSQLPSPTHTATIVATMAPRGAADADMTRSRSTSATSANSATSATSVRLDKVLCDAGVGVVVVDRQYDIQTINSAARQLLGIYAKRSGTT